MISTARRGASAWASSWLNDLNQKLTTFMWIVSAWFTFLTAVLAVFGFLRR